MTSKMTSHHMSISTLIASTTNSVKAGLVHNWSWYPAAGQKIEFRNLFNQIGMNRVTGEMEENGLMTEDI